MNNFSLENVSSQPIPLIYIVGIGRSGSTLLDMLLGAHTQIESVGELNRFKYFFNQAAGLESKRFCTCGKPTWECEYWAKVYGLMQAHLGKDVSSLAPEDLADFEVVNSLALRSILKSTGKTWIVDSSKRPNRLMSYLRSPSFDTHIVHIIRDGRATALSKTKGGHNLYYQAARWSKEHINIYLQWHKHPRYQMVRYEDLVSQTERTIDRILASVGLKFQPAQLLNWSTTLKHNLGGSLSRLKKHQTIQQNDEYLKILNTTQWFFTSLLTIPGSYFFNYPIFSRIQK